jgi:hypothetical protein
MNLKIEGTKVKIHLKKNYKPLAILQKTFIFALQNKSILLSSVG